MIDRLKLPVDYDGREVGSIALIEGSQLSSVDVDDTNPTTWGIMLCDLLRQAAISFELNGLMLDGRFLTATEIEAAIKNTLDNEFGAPTSEIEQKPPEAGGN